MATEDMKARLRRTIDEVWNNGNVDTLDELYASHCSFHDPSFPFEGVTGVLRRPVDHGRYGDR